MYIAKKYIRTFSKYENKLLDGELFFIGLPVEKSFDFKESLKKIGFSENVKTGEKILPCASNGKFSKENAQGKEIRLEEKEIIDIPFHWSLKDWGGNIHEGISYRQIEKYKRMHLPATSLEIEIREDNTNNKYAVIGPFKNKEIDKIFPITATNIFLEIFQKCQILGNNLQDLDNRKVKNLNWDIFPPGKVPWAKLQERIELVINHAKPGNRPIIRSHFETIQSYNPDYIACGNGGFSDYVIYGFSELKIYIVESNNIGNA